MRLKKEKKKKSTKQMESERRISEGKQKLEGQIDPGRLKEQRKRKMIKKEKDRRNRDKKKMRGEGRGSERKVILALNPFYIYSRSSFVSFLFQHRKKG